MPYKRKSPLWTLPLDQLKAVVASSSSRTGALKKLGYARLSASTTQLLIQVCEERGVDTSHFRAQKDNISWAQQQMANQKVEEWLNGKRVAHSNNTGQHALREWARRWILARADDRCEQCGWNEINPFTKKCPLHIHHIDGVATNSHPDNLQVLCPNCHSLTDNFGSRNKKCVRTGSRNYTSSISPSSSSS